MVGVGLHFTATLEWKPWQHQPYQVMVGVGLHFTATLEWKPRQHQHSGRRRTTLYSNAGVETLSLTG